MLLSILAVHPTDFWHDPFWQFIINLAVAIIIGALTIILSLLTNRKKHKGISYRLISNASIANITEDVEDKVTVLFEGNPVKNLSLIILKLWNSGTVAVKREDYDEPVKFTVEKGSVVGSDVLSTNPNDLPINARDVTLEQNAITLPKLLLNPKDEISLRVLVKDFQGKINGTARIVDGKITKEISTSSPFFSSIVKYGFFLNGVGALIGIVLGIIGFRNTFLFTYSIAVTAFLAGLLVPASPPVNDANTSKQTIFH